MRFAIVTLFPELFEGQTQSGVFARALRSGVLELEFFNPRDYADDARRSTDDRPFGGGAGMVMSYLPLTRAVQAARTALPDARTVLLSPRGRVFDQGLAVDTAAAEAALILVCGRYEGLDQRFIDRCIDVEWSIGDYVLSGGELAALVVMDAIARHLPGTLGNSQSKLDESHLDGSLDYPQYTRPEIVDDLQVPQVLLEGDHGRIAQFRRREALKKTYEARPDLLTRKLFSAADRALLTTCWQANDADAP